MKFQQKVFIAFLIFILLPIIILGVVSYHVSSSALKEKVGIETSQTLEAIDTNLQMVMSEINSFSNYVIASQEVGDFLKNNQQQAITHFYGNRQSMAGLLYTQSKLNDLILYSAKGEIYHFQKNDIPSLEKFKKTKLYEQIVNQKGKPVWQSPVENKIFTGDNLSFIHARVIRDFNTLEDIGYLIMKIKLERFDEIFINSQQNSEAMIVDGQEKIVYHHDRDMIGRTLNIKNKSNVFSEKEGTFIDYLDGEKSLITYISGSLSNGTNSKYSIVSIKPWHVITKETIFIRRITFFLVSLGLVFAGLFKLFFLNRIVSFITEFQKNMKKVEMGDLSTRMSTYTFWELNHLSNSFNEMVKNIVILMQRIKNEQERKRKAEFQVLQNQINPHFLYNTLESINAMAVLNDQEDISKMTINLGKLLRISINASDEVSVDNELRHVLSYMEIQKVRYNDLFNFHVHIDENLYHFKILKLVLQPLVENVLIHAFDRKKKGAIIHISGGINKGNGYFFIEDNGKGISNDKLITFYERNKGNHTDTQLGHGLMNVQERLKIYYGEQFGLMICSHVTVGTKIKLTFPIRKGVENEI